MDDLQRNQRPWLKGTCLAHGPSTDSRDCTPISFRFPTRAIPEHPSTMPVERLLKHARESRKPSFGGLLPVTKDRRIQGRANEKRYRLLVQGLRHHQASLHLASREGYARQNSSIYRVAYFNHLSNNFRSNEQRD